MAESCGERIGKVSLRSRSGLLPVQQEYLLVSTTCLLTFMALTGSVYLIQKLIKKRRKCGIQFVIYLSILIGNALMALTTMPMSVYFILAYRVPLSNDRDVFGNSTSISIMSTPEKIFCNISGFLFNVTRSTTLWSVCFFTFDRFLYVCFPFWAKRVVKYWHYSLVTVIIWLYFLLFSASPFAFGKLFYRHLNFEGLTCEWLIMDLVPEKLMVDNHFPYNVLLPYYIILIYTPTFLPVVLISVFSVAVVVELGKIHRKGALSRNVTASLKKKESENKSRRPSSYKSVYRKALQYLHGNREVKLSIIMLLTTIGFIVCYGLWIYIYAIHLGMILCLVEFSVLYVPFNGNEDTSTATVLSRLYFVHELVGFAHAAIEPLILYMVLAKPPKKYGSSTAMSMCQVTSPYTHCRVSEPPRGQGEPLNPSGDAQLASRKKSSLKFSASYSCRVSPGVNGDESRQRMLT